MRLSTLPLILSLLPLSAAAELSDVEATALQNIERASAIIDATWNTSIKGNTINLYLADRYNTITGEVSGPSDVWPYTAAIEAHCSILEALDAARELDPAIYEANYERHLRHLDMLIDNLAYYRGSFTLTSYTGKNRWQPYAVPRSNRRGSANVTGILNVYDDQMWLCRELTRAYRITNNDSYLQLATHLADYVIDGWDCWRDQDGNEYGGITWGPGYNSKHACSNAPFIQPLVWLADIYSDAASPEIDGSDDMEGNGSDETVIYKYRDANNNVVSEERSRSEHYLDFAQKIYAWQKSKLLHTSGTYWDMMGADNTILTADGYRLHVDCGAPTGELYSYNTGTMIAGAAELYRVTHDEAYRNDLTDMARASLTKFSKFIRKHNTYEFITDATAENGFRTWFNDVLMRAFVDATPYADNNSPKTALNSFQYNLDYAFENHNRDNMLPIRLLDGWGEESITKGFHQFAFASEYAILALWHLCNAEESAVELITRDNVTVCTDPIIYTLSGKSLGRRSVVLSTLSPGVYIINSKKIFLK